MSEPQTLNCKVVLLGESGVGKTCIITRFINNKFEENTMSTTGATFAGKAKKFDQGNGVIKTIQFQIWDTAGQERFRSLSKIFYKDAAIAIFVFDISRKESFDEIKKYWYTQVQEHSPKKISKCFIYNVLIWIVLGIAANKSDLFDKEEIDEDEVREFAKEIGAIFRLTSAYNSSGIDELFTALGNKYLDPNFVDSGVSGSKGIVLQNNEQQKEGAQKNKGGCCGDNKKN